MADNFRFSGVQSAMANPPFPIRIQTMPLPQLPTELISDRGRA
jgi:hypothetical protein